ncbi:MAG: hypothetical protein V4473_01880 [Patescibacteria group bacterium]
MHNPSIRYKALELRQKGTSLNEIATSLELKKSTVSYWCKNIVLKESAIKKIKIKGREKSVHALLRYSEIKRKERIERDFVQKKGGVNFVGAVSRRDILMAGFGLYWGEGYKVGELGFTNSNPKIIKFYLAWIKQFDVQKIDLIFRLTINQAFKSYEKQIKDFWVRFLGVKENQFSKTTCIQTILRKEFIPDTSSYKGVLRVKVRRGLSLKNKILGAIEHISTCV